MADGNTRRERSSPPRRQGLDEALAPLIGAAPPPSNGRIRTLAEARSALGVPTSADPHVLLIWGIPADYQAKAFPVIDCNDPRLVAEFAALRRLKTRDGRPLPAERGDRGHVNEAGALLWIVYGTVIQASDGVLMIESLNIGPAFATHENRTSTNPAHTINSQLLRLISPARLLTQTVEHLQRDGYWLQAHAERGGPQLSAKQRDLIDRIDQSRPKNTVVTDEHLADLAKTYIVLCTRGLRHPLPYLARAYGITREHARDRIHQARKRGYLTPSKQGRTNHALGPRLRQLNWNPPHPHPEHRRTDR
jgi:hypothetical protein